MKLTPAMRAALGTAQGGTAADQRGHYHGATLNALVRHGLARRTSVGGETEIHLTNEGLDARDRLRARVDEKLAAHGFQRAPVGLSLYTNPDEGGTCTRSGAMRATGVSW